MAETLVSKIVANAGKNWSRNTVADGNWLNANTIVKLNQNDKTLAEAIDSLSASMPHILPEYPGFKLDLESNETIKSIEQKTTGELIVEKQGIDIESTTLNDKLWAHLQTNKGCSVNNQYTKLYDEGEDAPVLNYLEPGDPGDGCTTSNLVLKPGIYSIYLELAYKPGNTIERIEKELSVRLCRLRNGLDPIDNAEFTFHCNDTYTEINQHRLVNAVVKFEEQGTLVIQGKTESGHAGGTLQIVNLYIVSVGGATGPKGDKGDKGDPGTPGSPGEKGDKTYLRIRQSDAKWEYSYDQTNWQLMENSPAASGTKGNDGDDGYSPAVTFNEISEGTRTGTEVKITDKDHQSGITYSAWNGMDGVNGTNGTNGITPSGSSERTTQEGIDGNLVSFKYNATGTDPRDFQFFVPDGQSTGATQIIGGQGIQADKASGEEKYTLTFSGGNFQNLSAASAIRSERAGYADAAGGLLDEAHNNYRWAQQLISAYDEFNNNYKTYVTSANNDFPNAGQYGIIKDTNGIHWGEIQGGGGSSVTVNPDTNVIKDGISAVSAASYYVNVNNNNYKAQRLFVVADNNDLITHTSYTNGQGSIYFVVGPRRT